MPDTEYRLAWIKDYIKSIDKSLKGLNKAAILIIENLSCIAVTNGASPDFAKYMEDKILKLKEENKEELRWEA